jgi:hypothetical protein
MIRYKVTALRLKKPYSFLSTPREGDTLGVEEGDTLGGYSQEKHEVGKFLDLWLSKPNEFDGRNLVSFGRVKHIEDNV